MVIPSLQRTIWAIIAVTTAAASAQPAMGCLGCVQPVKKTLLKKVEDSNRVVTAVPVDQTGSQWKVVDVVKGPKTQIGQFLLAKTDDSAVHRKTEGRQLLRRAEGSDRWSAETPIDPELVRFLRGALVLPDDRQELRLRYFLEHLEHADRHISESAYAKLARAPYADLRRLAPNLDSDRLLDSIHDPNTAATRGPLYVMLLGIGGHDRERTLIKKWIKTKWNRGQSDGIAALLTAHLELSGEPGVRFLEESYILNRDRQLGEISAAVDALRNHGEADGAVSRARVLMTYHRLLDQRPQLVELITQDCVRWRDWSFAAPLADIRASGQYPWSHRAIDEYLKACPLPTTKNLIGDSRRTR